MEAIYEPEVKTEKSEAAKELMHLIDTANKPIVELAGPTLQGYALLDGETLMKLKKEGKRIWISGFDPRKLSKQKLIEGSNRFLEKIMKTFGVSRQEAIQMIKPSENYVPEVSNAKWDETSRPLLDLEVDAMKQPFAAESIGGFFSSKIGRSELPLVIPEVYRTLAPGGFWAVQSISSEELEQAKELGFEVKNEITKETKDKDGSYLQSSVVLIKPQIVKETLQ